MNLSSISDLMGQLSVWNRERCHRVLCLGLEDDGRSTNGLSELGGG